MARKRGGVKVWWEVWRGKEVARAGRWCLYVRCPGACVSMFPSQSAVVGIEVVGE